MDLDDVDGGRGHGTLTCVVVLDDGSTVTVGVLSIADGKGSWGGPLGPEPDRLDRPSSSTAPGLSSPPPQSSEGEPIGESPTKRNGAVINENPVITAARDCRLAIAVGAASRYAIMSP